MNIRAVRRGMGVTTVGLLLLSGSGSRAESKVEKKPFGQLSDGQSVELYTLTNAHGMQVSITNYGATVVSLKVPGRPGQIDDVALGYDSIDGYVGGKAYFGATVGRYGNRIAHAKFMLDGNTYNLTKNDGENTLHGGKIGFNKRVWQSREVASKVGQALELTYLSKDGEEGYPGTLHASVTFTLPRDRDALVIEYQATTDKDTVVNLTNHTYFNLGGEGHGDILKHRLELVASHFTPVDATLIPTGEIRAVKGTPFDFTELFEIGARIGDDDPQMKFGKGYDHNWVLDRGGKGELIQAAVVFDPQSGRVLQVYTTEPGIQFYTGNFLDGSEHGKGGKSYAYRSAFCLETQHFPDSPNKPAFPSTELKPRKEYRSTTEYRFSMR
jgi:aldose 1-epimerase